LMGYNHQVCGWYPIYVYIYTVYIYICVCFIFTQEQSKAAWWFWGQHFISTIVSDTLVQRASGHWPKVVMMMADCNMISAMFLVRSCII
jgi:hypothetical protein